MAWRLAKSLETFRTQVNTAYPNRSKLSDGTIGDTSHASGPSDHNPNSAGVVTAFDLTHDPAHGVDTYKMADILRTRRHPDLKYIISNSRIAGAFTGWKWQPYNGANPHDHHMHVSVGVGNDGQSQPPYDDLTKWIIKEDIMLTDGNIDGLTRAAFGRAATQPEKDKYRGKPVGEIIPYLFEVAQKQRAEVNAKLATCEAEAKPLPKGKYIVQ